MEYRRVGSHYGEHTLAKLAGLGTRMLQMAPRTLLRRPDLAVSHGSRSMFLLASLLGIPTLTILDYEHVSWINWFRHSWVLAPEIIPQRAVSGFGARPDHILRYPGIKEDVYVPAFHPDPSIRELLGLAEGGLIMTVRPPASEAHYHNPESEVLLDAVFALLEKTAGAKAVLLPRTARQHEELRGKWPQLFAQEKVVVPTHAIDGLDLIWLSDLVISGGGTMNREAAALGVPVYSIFRGKLGAVGAVFVRHGQADVDFQTGRSGESDTASQSRFRGCSKIEGNERVDYGCAEHRPAVRAWARCAAADPLGLQLVTEAGEP